ncbi:MAG: type II toxin-antitoxin system RelE/ParE family toxin [Halothiobacillaceae bacterium]
MNFIFHPAAQHELSTAAEHYEQAQLGLGTAFVDEVYASVQRICAYPEAWTRLSSDVRRCLAHRFPYAVIYRVHHNDIQILAIAHLNRKPGYWNHRLKTS